MSVIPEQDRVIRHPKGALARRCPHLPDFGSVTLDLDVVDAGPVPVAARRRFDRVPSVRGAPSAFPRLPGCACLPTWVCMNAQDLHS